MREHTSGVIRNMLSSEDSHVIGALKAKEQHKFRTLSERNMSAGQIRNVLRLKPGDDPTKVFSKDYWSAIAQLAVHGEIDPQNMKPLMSPATASSLEKLGMGGVARVLGGFKRAAEASKLNTRSVFDDPYAMKCAKYYPMGSPEYYQCTGQAKAPAALNIGGSQRSSVPAKDTESRFKKMRQAISPHRFLKGGYGQNKTMEVTLPLGMSARDKRNLPILQRVLHNKMGEYDNIRDLAAAIADLDK